MKRLLLPVISNITLFNITIFLLGAFDVVYHYHLFHEVEFPDIVMDLTEMIFMAYLICICSYFLRKIHLKVFFYVILFIIYTFNCYLLYQFNSDIAPNIILLLFETNSKEVSGFFQNFFFTPATLKTVIIVGFLLIMTIIGEYYNKRISQFASKPVAMCVIAVILLIGCIGGVFATKRYWDLARSKRAYDAEVWIRNKLYYHIMPFPNLLYSFSAIKLAEQDLVHMIEATEKSLNDINLTDSDSLNIVLVIGESYNKYHSTLYGYDLDTTPYQIEEQEKGNLYAFTHIEAPFNMTSIVLKNMFSCNSVFEGEKWHDYPFFPAIFKKAGYDVWLWDNQYQVGQEMPWCFTLNSIIFNNQIKQVSYTAINEKCFTFDDELITDFENSKKQLLGSHNLVIFHLFGQHTPSGAQFPQNKNHLVYSIKDIPFTHPYLTYASRQEIVDYDNATRYNDEVIKHIMNIFKETNTILIYFSDHGEEVYDYRNYCGRTMLQGEDITPSLLKYQIEIPFMVWASDKWQKQNPKEWQNIGLAIDKTFTTDNVCHFLFHLAGIKTKEYKPERDLFSPKFIPAKKHDIMTAL
jgi:heptose-I-phosphate ethanolaminephosphotransferase